MNVMVRSLIWELLLTYKSKLIFIVTKECCGSCRHCVPGDTGLFALCRIRKIKIHPQIVTFAFCHHWVKKEPTLPLIEDKMIETFDDKQLDFGKVLVSKDY